MNSQHSHRMFLYKHDDRCTTSMTASFQSGRQAVSESSHRMFLYKHDDRCTTSITASFQSGRQAVSESQIPKPLDWSWRYKELATTVTGSEPIRLPCVGSYESVVCAHKMNTRVELLQRILSTARSINNAAVLRDVTSSVGRQVRKFIQADGGHFEQLA